LAAPTATDSTVTDGDTNAGPEAGEQSAGRRTVRPRPSPTRNQSICESAPARCGVVGVAGTQTRDDDEGQERNAKSTPRRPRRRRARRPTVVENESCAAHHVAEPLAGQREAQPHNGRQASAESRTPRLAPS
jgi:hypothetical protein